MKLFLAATIVWILTTSQILSSARAQAQTLDVPLYLFIFDNFVVQDEGSCHPDSISTTELKISGFAESRPYRESLALSAGNPAYVVAESSPVEGQPGCFYTFDVSLPISTDYLFSLSSDVIGDVKVRDIERAGFVFLAADENGEVDTETLEFTPPGSGTSSATPSDRGLIPTIGGAEPSTPAPDYQATIDAQATTIANLSTTSTVTPEPTVTSSSAAIAPLAATSTLESTATSQSTSTLEPIPTATATVAPTNAPTATSKPTKVSSPTTTVAPTVSASPRSTKANAPTVSRDEPTNEASTNRGPTDNDTYIVEGHLYLFDTDVRNTRTGCYGTGGYSDLGTGGQVLILDGQQNVLGVGRLETTGETALGCEWTFSIEVPEAEFYQINIGHRSPVVYTLEELEELQWLVELSIG